MRCAEAAIRHADRRPAQAFLDAVGQHCKALGDRRRPPLGHHLHADRGHFHRNEMIALAHVETQSTGDVTRIRKIRGVIGTHVAAAIGGLLERNAVLMTLGDIEEGRGHRARSAICRSGRPQNPDRGF
jgi:hypothetical protein